jgi:hypothetical protein
MPGPELASLSQKAVLWPIKGYDRYGQPKVSDTPVEIQVRWNDSRSESQGRDDNTISVSAQILTDRRVVNGSLMWLGKLSDFPGDTKDPYTYNGDQGPLMVVTKYDGTPDIKGRRVTHSVSATRYRDTLPPSGA